MNGGWNIFFCPVRIQAPGAYVPVRAKEEVPCLQSNRRKLMSVPSRKRADPSVASLAIWSAVIAAVAAVGLLLSPATSAYSGAPPVGASANVNVSGDVTGFESLAVPERIDHSMVNRQNLPDEPNPAPLAVASYDQ
jgi:hypothetical protein